MNRRATILIVPLFLFAPFLVGCSSQHESAAETHSLPIINGSELQSFVAMSEKPVLVEFGVDYRCERCRQMKQPVIELAKKFDGRATVVRVDFNSNAGLVSRYGGTVCPTYVFFVGGKPVRTESFPISADILSSLLEPMTQSAE